MNWTVLILPAFVKQLATLPKGVRSRAETFVFETLPQANNPYGVHGIEKLEGYKEYYKARFGQYRLGLKIDKNRREVTVCCIFHRREIYRHFP
jgi:mRNA interferase RelE/StbE